MDIAKRKPTERTIEIFDPAIEDFKTGIKVTLMSLADDRMKTIKRQIQDTRLRLEQKNKSFKAEEIDANRNNLAFKAMIAWEWGKDSNGEPALFNGEVPEFTQRNIMAVFEEAPWFRDQIEIAISEEKDFFQK